MTSFLNAIGYSIDFVKNVAILNKRQTKYAFQSDSNIIKIYSKDAVKEKTISYTPLIDYREKKIWLPMQSILNDLGYDFQYQANKITILKKLNHIEIPSNTSNTIAISKNSNLSLIKTYYLNNPNRIFWDFEYTLCPKNIIKSPTTLISKVYFGQHKYTCRMVLETNGSLSASITNQTPTISNIILKRKQATPNKKAVSKKTNTTRSRSLKGKVIIIDPGHGGRDPGAVTKNNDYEKHYTLDISKRIKRQLTQAGAKVYMLRTKDTEPIAISTSSKNKPYPWRSFSKCSCKLIY